MGGMRLGHGTGFLKFQKGNHRQAGEHAVKLALLGQDVRIEFDGSQWLTVRHEPRDDARPAERTAYGRPV